MENLISDLLNEAVIELNNVNVGEIFLVRELFKGYIWNRLTIPTRLRLGILFYESIKKMPDTIQILQKNKANQQKYQKIN